MSYQQYRSVPTGEEAGGVQPFELDDEQNTYQHDKRQNNYVQFMASLFALLVVVVGFGVHVGGGNRASPAELSADAPDKSVQAGGLDAYEIFPKKKLEAPPAPPPAEVSADAPAKSARAEGVDAFKIFADEKLEAPPELKMIFCYGDSLTYGMSPPSKDSYPYATYLEQELNTLYLNTTVVDEAEYQEPGPHLATIVQHAGFPGMTASTMLDRIHGQKDGICTILHGNSTISLMIILAGTNDILQMTNSGADVARSIAESLVNLHESAFDCAKTEGNSNFRTLALGIPGSAYYEKVRITGETSAYVNNALKEYSASSEGNTTYVEFPFLYEEGDSKWSNDGLHMSREGYEVLGKELASHVKKILDDIDSFGSNNTLP